MKSFAALLSLALPAFVSAHGYVRTITVDGQKFTGNVPNGRTSPSAIRQINDVGPVKGASNAANSCGPNAQIASDVLKANPGSTLQFLWAGGDNSNWPHDTGPMLTYLASCGNTPCNKFNAQSARWFKIDEQGRRADGTWFQSDLKKNNAPATVNLPQTLAAGNYLVRHEIIGLHIATTQGGAEFYPSCAQLSVGGNQKGAPSPNELVSFPGAYKDTDKGILVPDIFNTKAKYTFPGPPVARLSATAAPAPAAAASADSAPESSVPVADEPESDEPESDAPESDEPESDAPESDEPESKAPATAAPSSGAPVPPPAPIIKPANASTKAADAKANTARPRQISRIMRDLQHST